MAPSGRTANNTSRTKTTTATKRRTRTRTRQPRRTTHFKKQQQQHNTQSSKEETSTTTVLPSSCSSIISSQDSSKEEGDMEISEVIDVSNSNSACSTPKGQKFRIPEISTCPPAPKKPRVLSNCSLRRSPLSFFAPPDLELFFFVALRDVSV